MEPSTIRGRCTRGTRFLPAAVFALFAVATIGFQAAYVFLPAANVVRDDGYDSMAHFQYFSFVNENPEKALSYRGSYTWVHFPFFYEINSVVTDAFCRLTSWSRCAAKGLKVAWFLQAVLRLGTLAVLWATFHRVVGSGWGAALALGLTVLSPRVFFSTCIWNQEEFVLFFAALCMYATVTALRDGLTWSRQLGLALAVAVGFHFKQTIMIPAVASLFALLLLPGVRASWARKLSTVALAGICVVVGNWSLFFTPDGREHLTWHLAGQCPGFRQNSDDLSGAYLTLSAGPLLRPEPIYVPVSEEDQTGKNSTATGLILYTFELYDHFQGPPRTWLNLACSWSGIILLFVIAWRTVRIVIAWWTGREAALAEVYCAALVWLSFAGLVYISLRFCFGWAAHPEYVLAAYPAAAVLIVRHLQQPRSRAARVGLWAIVTLHLAANSLMVLHAGRYKIELNRPGVIRGQAVSGVPEGGARTQRSTSNQYDQP